MIFLLKMVILCNFQYPCNCLPHGKTEKFPLVNVYIAIENGPVEIVDFPMKNGGSFHSYVKLPEDKSH